MIAHHMSAMVLWNVQIVIVFQCWSCSATAIGRYAHRSLFDGGRLSDAEMIKQLDVGLNAILSSSAGSASGDAAKKRLLKSKVFEGFFGDYHRSLADNNRNKSSPGRHRDSTTFVAEEECESMNRGRPCVCSMADFLDSVCQRLDDSASAFDECTSYKPVRTEFVISPVAPATAATAAEQDVRIVKKIVKGNNRGGSNETAVAVAWRRVDFDNIINYLVEKPKDDNYAVHYVLVGSDYRVNCLISPDSYSTEKNTFNWIFKKGKHKTNSTISNTNTNQLMISRMEPGDSKNYTCVSSTVSTDNYKNTTYYTHYVIAVEKPIYEIRGTAYYKTNRFGCCNQNMIKSLKKQLPNYMQTEICPDGSSGYACNVVIETLNCIENNKMLEVTYLLTLNNNSDYLAKIETYENGRNALKYQKLLARISKVLVRNLNKSMTVNFTSKLSLIKTNFKPVYGLMKMTKYIFCPSGYGLREVFCGACPPHHFSPDKSTECLKCPKWFHQPIAGSEKCVKCPTIFASGCYLEEVSLFWYCVTAFIVLMICFICVAYSCMYCCREESKIIMKVMKRKSRKKLKKRKKYTLLSDCTNTTDDSSEPTWEQFKKIKKLVNFNKKPKCDKLNANNNFHVVHNKVGRHILNNHEQSD